MTKALLNQEGSLSCRIYMTITGFDKGNGKKYTISTNETGYIGSAYYPNMKRDFNKAKKACIEHVFYQLTNEYNLESAYVVYYQILSYDITYFPVKEYGADKVSTNKSYSIKTKTRKVYVKRSGKRIPINRKFVEVRRNDKVYARERFSYSSIKSLNKDDVEIEHSYLITNKERTRGRITYRK